MTASTAQTMRAAQKRADVVRLARESGTSGLTMAELREVTGCSLTVIGNALRVARDEGIVEASQPFGGPGNRWGAPGTRAAYEAANAGRMAALRAIRDRRKRCAERKRKDAEVVGGFDRPSIMRIVPAHLCAPLGRVGIASVWELAA